MRNRDARQPGKLCLAEHLMLTLTDVLHRRSRQVFMSGIHARQQGNVFDRVPSHKARPARRSRLDLPLAHPLPDQARYLRPAQSGYLHQVTPHDSPLPFTQPCVPLRSQYPLHQIVNISLLVRVKTYRPAPFNQFLHLGQTQPFQILHDDLHSPAACLFSPSPVQAHPALESNVVFRLIHHWKRHLVSGSSCIGQFCRLTGRERVLYTGRNRMFILLTTIHVVVCVFLIIVVLLQSGKAADLAGAFGGMGSQTAFGPRGSATLLSKATSGSALLLLITSLSLSIMATRQTGVGSTILDKHPGP